MRKLKTVTKVIGFSFMAILSIYGAFFFSVLSHEITHIYDFGNESKSLCIPLNNKDDTRAYVELNTYQNEDSIVKSEKHASAIQHLVNNSLMLPIGIFIGLFVANASYSRQG